MDPSGAIELRVDALLFDMDGTIADSVAAIEVTWGAWAREFGVESPDLAKYHGKTAAAIVADLLPENLVAAAKARIDELEADPSLPCAPTPGSQELIASLPADRWGVVTSAVRAVALSRLTTAGFGEPPVFVNGDEVTHGKPDPEPFRLGRERIGFAEGAGTVIAFEDTVTGLRSAREAGCITVGIVGTESYESLARSADYVVSSLDRVRVSCIDETGVRLSIVL